MKYPIPMNEYSLGFSSEFNIKEILTPLFSTRSYNSFVLFILGYRYSQLIFIMQTRKYGEPGRHGLECD